MLIQENPFYILGATPRDGRRRIAELADEKALLNNAAGEARSILTTPSRRLWAELRWFPCTQDMVISAIIHKCAVLHGDESLVEEPDLYVTSGLAQLNERRYLAAAIPKEQYAEYAKKAEGLETILNQFWEISESFESLDWRRSFFRLLRIDSDNRFQRQPIVCFRERSTFQQRKNRTDMLPGRDRR